MKTCSCLTSLGALLLTLSAAAADPKADVTAAIKKLESQSGYSWTSTPKVEGSEAGRRAGPVEGKADKDGLTYFKGTISDNTFEVASRGEKLVVNYTGEWLTPTELGALDQVNRLRQTLKKPADEATALTGQVAELKKEADGTYAGELEPASAKALFAVLGRRAAAAPEAKGTVKFWVKDGQLAKFEHVVRGKITVGEDKKEVEISRTLTVEIKDVGSTKISLPETATKKL